MSIRHHRQRLLVLFGLLLVGPAGYCQATSGALSGIVTNQDTGKGMPETVVEAVHQPTGTRYTTITGPKGRFRIPHARVGGPYTVDAGCPGFHDQQAIFIFVALGNEVRLSFALQPDSADETLYNIANSSLLINPSRIGSISNVGTHAIENLPTLGRGLLDFAGTNPFFVVSSHDEDVNAISVAGRSSLYNTLLIDGAVNGDLFGLAGTGTPAGRAGTTPISLDAIRELQLLLAPFDVRQGGFSGGAMNAITRSGSNAWSASLFYYTANDSLAGEGPDETGDFSAEQYGLRLGGPIRQNKLFFFVNTDIEKETRSTGWSIDGTGGQTFGNGQLVEEGQRFRNTLISQYGFDPGGLGQSSGERRSDKVFARLDLNIGDHHRVTLRHNYVDARNGVNRPSSRTYEWPSEAYVLTSKANSTVAQLNSTIGSTMFNELRISHQTISDHRAPRGGIDFPWIVIEDVAGDFTFDFEFEAGTEPSSTFSSLDQKVLEITNDFTWLRGDHTWTFGTHNEFSSIEDLQIRNGFGAYVFTNLDSFEAGLARRYRHTFTNPGQNPRAGFDVGQIGLYASDQWLARDNLTITFGVRVDVPFFPDTPVRNPATETLYGFRTDEMPDGKTLLQPRIGFNWDLSGDSKQQLRGGVGIFAGRLPYVWISSLFSRNGLTFTDLTATGSIPFNPDPFHQQTDIGTSIRQEINLIDPDFESPTVLRLSLAYDRELPWLGLVGTIEAILTDSREEIDYKNLNLAPNGVVPFDHRPFYDQLSSDFGGVFLITNSGKGRSTNMAIKIERRYRDGFAGFVSYAYGDSKAINDGTSRSVLSNWQLNEQVDVNNARLSISDFQVEHRFNASASFRIHRHSRFPTTVSAFYNHQSGRPYTTILGAGFPFTSINGDGFGFNDPMYVPVDGSDVILTNGSYADLDAYIASAGLSGYKGQIAPRNAGSAPWHHRLDLRIAQHIPVGLGSLQVSLDIENLSNLLDESSGQLRYVQFGAVTAATFVGTDTATSKPIYTLSRVVTDPDNNTRYQTHGVQSRYRMRLGLRWAF